jgi:hypothetical protein
MSDSYLSVARIRLAKVIALAIGTAIVLAFALSAAANARAASPAAGIKRDVPCGLLSPAGPVLASDSQFVRNSQNASLVCSGDVSNPTGKAIVFKGFLCGLGRAGVTTESIEIISASGEATLKCHS